MRRTTSGLALMLALGALGGSLGGRAAQLQKPINEAERKRKLSKSEKKRAKRAERNLRIAAVRPQEKQP